MKATLFLLLCLAPSAAGAQTIEPGNWDVKSTAVELDVPGTPAFLLRMMKGKSKVEHKCVAPDAAKAGILAILAPDPKAKCRVESQQASGGRFDQVLQCQQKDGSPLHVVRGGSYGATTYSARMTMTGQSSKGAMRMVIDQSAAHTGARCSK